MDMLSAVDETAQVAIEGGGTASLKSLCEKSPVKTDATSLKLLALFIQYRLFAHEQKEGAGFYPSLTVTCDGPRFASISTKEPRDVKLFFAGNVTLQQTADSFFLVGLGPFAYYVNGVNFDRAGCETLLPAWLVPVETAPGPSRAKSGKSGNQDKPEKPADTTSDPVTCEFHEALLNVPVPGFLMKEPGTMPNYTLTVKLPYLKVKDSYAYETPVKLARPRAAPGTAAESGPPTAADDAEDSVKGSRGRARRGGKGTAGRGGGEDAGSTKVLVDFTKLGPQCFAARGGHVPKAAKKAKVAAPHLTA